MPRQKRTTTTDQVQPPVMDGAAPPPPPVTAPEGADQAQAGVGGAPAETMQGAQDAPMNTSGDASEDPLGEVAAQMPKEPAAVPPAAGDAPAATSTTYDTKNVNVSIVGNPVLRVTGPAKGRWRAGRHFTPETVTIPVRDLNEDEMAALHTDPELVVQFHNDI